MKIVRLIFFSLCCWMCVTAQAQLQDEVILKVSEVEKGRIWQVDVDFNNAASDNYTAFQMDFLFPDSFQYVENSLSPGTRLLAHTVSAAKRPGSIFRVVAYSHTNSEITGRTGALYSLQLQAVDRLTAGSQLLKAQNIHFVKRDGVECRLSDAQTTFTTAPTGIADLQADTYVEVYNLQGMRISSGLTWKEARRQLPKGIYIVNGQLRAVYP